MNQDFNPEVISLSPNCTAQENESTDQMGDLLPTLLQIFLTIKLGWLAGFYKIISPQDARGLNIFVGKFSLPVLIFVSLASLDFGNVNWSFLLAITISKTLIFIFVGIGEYLVYSPKNLSRASIFAIFCTQTNDFGMGLPILDAVYGHDHPFVGLLYLVAPTSLLILNPIGFVLMEAEKTSTQEKSGAMQKLKTLFVVLRGLLMNPIVSMTVLGIVANLIFQGNLPFAITKFLNALGAAFTSMAPFTLGLSMNGKLGNIRGHVLKPILALVVTKSILTPILTHILVDQMSLLFTGTMDPALSNFGFLYGTFPTALGVDSYAGQYNVNPDLISAAIVICTIFSAPLMYVAANILTVLDMDKAQFLVNLMSFQYDVCLFSIIGIMLIAIIFVISKRYMRMPHSITMSLLVLSLETAIGGLIWSDGNKSNVWKRYLEVILHLHGIYSCRLSTGSLAITLKLFGSNRHLLNRRLSIALVSAGPIAAAILVGMLVVFLPLSEDFGEDLMLAFGSVQDYVNIVVLSISMVVSLICLTMMQRSEMEANGSIEENLVGKSCPALTFTAGEKCDKNEDEENDKTTSETYSPQMFRHTLLLMLLCSSMFSGIALSICRLGHIWDTQGAFPGVYKVLIFLDTFLASGQGLLFLAVFALDCKYILLPISRAVQYLKEKFSSNGTHLPTWITMDRNSNLESK